jgi:hypothetical protein
MRSSIDQEAEQLRYAYNLLPYSVERSRAKLKEVFPYGLSGVILSSEAGVAVAASSSAGLSVPGKE